MGWAVISNAQVKDSIDVADEPFRLVAFDIYLQRGFPTGDNFVGNGFEPGIGFGSRIQFYVYKDIYVGGALTQDYFDVKNPAATGLFDRTTKFNAYLYAGYDYKLNDIWRVQADLGYGYSQNKNRLDSGNGGGKFRDAGNVLRLTTNLEYEFTEGVSVVLTPSYEKVFYDIRVPQAREQQFASGDYLNIGLGVRFNWYDFNNREIKAVDKSLEELQSMDEDEMTIKEKRALFFLEKKERRRQRREARRGG